MFDPCREFGSTLEEPLHIAASTAASVMPATNPYAAGRIVSQTLRLILFTMFVSDNML